MRVHPDPGGLYQAHPRQRVCRPVQGRPGPQGHHHPGGGLCGGRVHRLHPRLSALLHRHGQGLSQEGLSDPRERQGRQGHQHREHPPGGAGGAGPDHDPLPGLYRGGAVSVHGHPPGHGEAPGGVCPEEHPGQRHPGPAPGRGGRPHLRAGDRRRPGRAHRHPRRPGHPLR